MKKPGKSLLSNSGQLISLGIVFLLVFICGNSAQAKVQVASGAVQTVTLNHARTAWAWEGNYNGQLGDGTNVKKSQPLQATGLSPLTLLGDVNNDGLVNAADAILCLQVISGYKPAGMRSDYVTSGADVNGDGKIGLAEVLYILRCSGDSSCDNSPAATISGPGGSTLTTPVGGLNAGATIAMTEAADTSGLLEDGETLVSKALILETSSGEALFGDGTFSVLIPVDQSKINDVNKLELKVRLTTGVSYPLFGVYDAQSGGFKVELSGVVNGWKLAVVEDPSIQIFRTSSSESGSADASLPLAGWRTDPDWKTYAWVVQNHTQLSDAEINNITAAMLPVLRDTSETLAKAGFRSPKIYLDTRLEPAARVCHLVNGPGKSHFHPGLIQLADGTLTYTEEQAGFDSTLLDAEQLSALGQVYVNWDQYLAYKAAYGTSLGDVVIHELFHAVQYGYDVRKKERSLFAYLEGTATPLGQTYQDTGGSITGPSISVRPFPPDQHARLYQAVDDGAKPRDYTKQDFFAYVTKRYGGNDFTWIDQLFESLSKWTANKFGLTDSQYREIYRKATDEVFSGLFNKGLSRIYFEYALDRAYEHGPNSVLRPAKETKQNGFGQNHLAKTLFQWSPNDTEGLKKFEPQAVASIEFPKIVPLSCYAFYMVLPAQADPEAPAGFPLVFKLEGGEMPQASDNGMKIVAFLEDINGDMVANGRIEITDVSKPVLIPLDPDAVNLTVLIINCYIEDKTAKVTVSAGPYIESIAPNPAEPGDTLTLQGISFGAAQDMSKLYLSDNEILQITSWSNTEIVFTLPNDATSGKVKVFVNGSASNEVDLTIEVPEASRFNFLQTWSKEHDLWETWEIEHATINFTAFVNGWVLNTLNPKIAVGNYDNIDNTKWVEITNTKDNEVVTVEGNINMSLSAFTVSPSATYIMRTYSYSNPRLVRYVFGELVETYQDMNFRWVVDSPYWGHYETDIRVVYDIEEKEYTRDFETDPFTLVNTYNYESTEFYLDILVYKDVLRSSTL